MNWGACVCRSLLGPWNYKNQPGPQEWANAGVGSYVCQSPPRGRCHLSHLGPWEVVIAMVKRGLALWEAHWGLGP